MLTKLLKPFLTLPRFMTMTTQKPQTIKLSDYDAYGFDIDHTLAKYNLPHLFDTVYRALAEYLVDQKNYDPCLLQPFDNDFCTRGLIFDLENGNLMKLAEDGTVLRASHGTKFMSEEELNEVYGPKKHWKHFEDMIDEVNNKDGYRIFENFFDMPGSVISARLVDLADRQAGGKAEAYTFFPDLFDAYNDVYMYTQFEEHKGGYFPLFKENPEKFLTKCSPDVKDWLKRLKKSNKRLFVMTSAYVDCANFAMEYVIGPDWRDYFDYFLFYARKPGFFKQDRPFLRLDGIKQCNPIDVLPEGQFVAQGNLTMLMDTLSQSLDIDDPKVLYFGDSVRSDIFPSKKYANWETIMVLEEMAAEVGTLYPETPDDRPSPKIPKLAGPSQLEKEYLTSLQWGSYFTDDHVIENIHEDGQKYMNTLWGYIVRKYADVAIPQLEAITDYPLNHKFTVFNHEVARIWGFHPHLPEALMDKPPDTETQKPKEFDDEDNSPSPRTPLSDSDPDHKSGAPAMEECE